MPSMGIANMYFKVTQLRQTGSSFSSTLFSWAFPCSVTDVPSTGCPQSLSCAQPLQPVMPKFCLLDLCLVLQCRPFSIVTERSARGGARMAPSTDGSLLWSARLLIVLPAADSCFRDGNGIPLPPRCQRSHWLLIPDTTRSLLGLVQCLPSELSACWPRPVACTQATAVP